MINVYLICSEVGNDKLHKIGYTKRSVEKRMKEFRTGNSSSMYIIDTFNSVWGTKIEARLKSKHKSKRINGEWFNLNDTDISEFKKDCQLIHDNFELISNSNTYYIDRGRF